MAQKSNRRKRTPTAEVPAVSVRSKRAPDAGGEAMASPLCWRWAESRSGAVAGRGHHYQDLVGAWVALQVLTGDIDAGRVLPEGFEDLTCESGTPQQVQVKSRQERVGDFRAASRATPNRSAIATASSGSSTCVGHALPCPLEGGTESLVGGDLLEHIRVCPGPQRGHRSPGLCFNAADVRPVR